MGRWQNQGDNDHVKTHDFEICGQTFHFCMNGAALFDCYDKFGPEKSVLDNVEGNSRRAFDASCWMLAKFAEQGELVRRYQGFKPEKIPTEAYFRSNLAPLDVPAAKLILQAVVRLGFARTEDEEKEIDIGLLELEKKTTNT